MRFSFRFWLSVALGFLLSIGLSLNFLGMAQAPRADELNQQGFSLLNTGAAADAFTRWKEAETAYRTEGNEEGVVGTQLNQALAQQALGLHPQACNTIADALRISSHLCEPGAGKELVRAELLRVDNIPVNTIGIRLLGEGLGSLSNLDEAIATLMIAQERTAESSLEKSSITLALGNIYRLLFQSAWQDYRSLSYREIQSRERKLSEAIDMSDVAIRIYERAASDTSEEIAAKAEVNTISLLAYLLENESDLNLETDELAQQLVDASQKAYTRLELATLEKLPVIDSIYTRLNLATHLSEIAGSRYRDQFDGLGSKESSRRLIESATSLAESIDDRRALSAAYGTAGNHIRAEEASVSLAATQYRKALEIAQSVQADDIAYDWAYQLAKINDQEGDLEQADRFYQIALSALAGVRDDLLAIDSELRFSFRKKIEPVYKSYIGFLVEQAPSSLQKALEVHSSLQLAQIENLLRCGRLTATSENTKTTVHIINLEETNGTVEVIISQNNQEYGYSVSAAPVTTAVESLASNVKSPRFLDIPEEEFLPYAQLLYKELLGPAVAQNLLPAGSEISFVLDTPFQAIPIGLLHDGKQYLAISNPVSISLQMQKVKEPSTASRALFAGLSELSPSFATASELGEFRPLPDTEREASYLSKYTEPRILLNQQFTVDRFADEISSTDYEIVHISTHSQFSSEPKETFLLAWDQAIDFADLGTAFQQARNIDLLFLSSCQTATGDEQTSLGLAGLAVQSGARNAVATLWLVDSVATSVLVDSFYKELSAGLGPTKALQRAQLDLIESSDNAFKHPYYWASFILAAS